MLRAVESERVSIISGTQIVPLFNVLLPIPGAILKVITILNQFK